MLLAILIFDIPFHYDIHYGYDLHMAELNALGGLQLSLTSFCVLGLYVLWFAEASLHRFAVSSPSAPRVSRWLILYLAAVVVSALFAPRRDLAFFELSMLLQTFLVYFYIIKKVRTRSDILYLVFVLLASMLLQSLAMIGVFAIGYSITLGPWVLETNGGRVGGHSGIAECRC